MNILLLGYGKMGKSIEQRALARNHKVPYKINSSNRNEFLNLKESEVDVAIEFSNPVSSYENIRICLEKGIPVVCGTTGWLERKSEIEELCRAKKGAFFYSSNYTLGVNIFFQLNKIAARIMNNFPEYEINMEEIHHVHKLDAPSGTAITLAEGIIENVDRKSQWVNHSEVRDDQIYITDKRTGETPGTHSVFYTSEIDAIELKHTAHTREGFAVGAVAAAEWIKGKSGIFGMEDMLKFNF
jgi:4-hydroxy-tetrahydrodipicolinate reductase